MRPDPPVRRDGLCAVCRKKRPLRIAANSTISRANRKLLEEMIAQDPFCSNVCAATHQKQGSVAGQ